MKKLLLVLLAAVLIVSCQKKDVETTPALKDVSFKAIEVVPDLKSSADWECKDDIPTHAWVQINGNDYYPELFELDGQLYTQAIKLAEGVDYCVENFVLYKEGNGIDGYQADPVGDVVVFGTPLFGSHYEPYVTRPLDYCFDVAAFVKTQIDLQVLCYQDADYDKFGFNWFAVTEIVIRQACFFGDLCIEDPAAFENEAPYSTGGIDVDEEAYIRVIVQADGEDVPYPLNDNLSIYGTGEPLCVDYPDNLSVDGETFTFEVQVWQPDASGIFYWQTYETFTTTDDNPLTETDNDQNPATDNDDGVVDFAVGDCSPDSYPIFEWLPTVLSANWETFYIRNNNGTIVSPWDADIVLIENVDGDGFSAATPRGGQKVGYGTNAFDGINVNTIEEVNFDKISGSPNAPIPYLNFWVTDGTNYAVIACGATDYRGQDLLILDEWPVYEYNPAVDLDWLFDSGDGSTGAGWGGHHLYLDGVPATLGDLGNNIILFSGPDYTSPGIGTGAPRGGFGFNIIFGDTQANYVGSYQIGNLSVTVDGQIYYATN